MDIARLMKDWIYRLSALLNVVGLVLVLLMVALIVIDILSRLLFNIAVQGSYELVEYMMGLVIAFAIGYTQVQNGHIRINSLVDLFPEAIRSAMERLAKLVGLLIFGLITCETFIKAGLEIKAGTTSAVLYIPKYPFMYACSLGFAVLTLVYLMQILLPDDSDQNTKEKQDLIV